MKKTLLLQSSVKQLGSNLVTTLLMCLGITVGIAVLIAVIALAKGTQARILDRVDRVGVADVFTVRTVPWGQGGGGLRDEDGRFLLHMVDILSVQDNISGISAILPSLNSRSTVMAGNSYYDDVSVQGVFPGFEEVRGWTVVSGTFFSKNDIAKGTMTAVVGPAVGNWLTSGYNPVGQILVIEGLELEIIGVLESRGASGSGRNPDETVLVPHGVFTLLFDPVGLSTVNIIVSDANNIEKIANQVKNYLEDIYPGQELFIRYSMATARARDEMSDTLSFYLIAIAIIVLIIGGVVMMNLSSLSIVARTREIGLRKALGARNSDISRQVMTEILIISLAAGMVGILLGYILGNALATHYGLRSLMTWHAPAAGLLTAFLTGMIFGVRPAKKAAMSDPVVCLRGVIR